jgi:DNA-binding NtrC family response regulator
MKDRVLVIDDLALWRNIIKEALEENYEVDTAASLKEALDLLLAADPYQVVITDIGLSENETNTDGIDILKAVHRHSPTTQTIAVSGRSAVANQQKFQEEYHALVFLDREVLFNDMDEFIAWVAKGVALSKEVDYGRINWFSDGEG